MKRIIRYANLIVIFIVFISCSKNDIADKTSIRGTWKLSSFTLKTPIDLNNDGTSTSTFSPGCLNGSNLEFTDTSNGTLLFTSSVSYNTTNENGTLVFMTACSTDSELLPSPITYIMDGETVIVTNNSEQYILTLEGNTLLMEIANGFIATDTDTFEITSSQDITYIFTKL